MSERGRRRRLLAWTKVTGLVVAFTGAAWGLYELAHSWTTDRAGLANAVHSEPVKEIAVVTTGVLNQKWAIDVMGVPKGASLMALDLQALKAKLTAYGQIRLAVLTRSFPDTLVVTLQERTPVARIQASDGLRTRQLLVAKDGVVYEGQGYDRQLIASLPWLDGVRLVKTADGFAPIAGMEDVSELLSRAQLDAPHLYKNWLVVSLERLASADEIIVKSQDVPQIVFSRKRNFFKQMAQLDYVIDRSHLLPDPQIRSVNLTYEGQVPVRLESTPEEAVSSLRPDFPVQPSSQRKPKRDL